MRAIVGLKPASERRPPPRRANPASKAAGGPAQARKAAAAEAETPAAAIAELRKAVSSVERLHHATSSLRCNLPWESFLDF